MSGFLSEIPKPSSPIRPKHQVTRSITEVNPILPTFHKIHLSHHHNHGHSYLHRKDDRLLQTTHLNVQTQELIEGTKSEGVTPAQSRAGSQRTSSLGDWDALGLPGREKRTVTEGELIEEREKGVLRAAELRNVLVELNAHSNNTTGRLDNIYYSVLEKVSALQNMVMTLKELALMTRQLDEEFKRESGAVVKDVETQLDGFEGFEGQHKRIKDLQERVKKGREKIKTLGSRVDIVRERVEGWGKAEEEWQEKTRKRLKRLWILMAVGAAAVLALVVFQNTPGRTEGAEAMNASSLSREVLGMGDIKNETLALRRSTVDGLEKILQNSAVGKVDDDDNDDPRLRMFDEL